MPEQEAAGLWKLSDLCTPWLIHVVATLRIADHIDAGIDQIGPLPTRRAVIPMPFTGRSHTLRTRECSRRRPLAGSL